MHEEMTLKEIFAELDGIIEKMQDQELSLEDTFAFYRQGVGLVQAANRKIEKVECDIKVLDSQENNG